MMLRRHPTMRDVLSDRLPRSGVGTGPLHAGTRLVEQDGTTFLIARELKEGAKVVTLRDERGAPAWSGGPRR